MFIEVKGEIFLSLGEVIGNLSRLVIGLKILSMREEQTTEMELRAMAAPANIGSSLN